MIKIDGRECGRKISEFSNLEELLSGVMQEAGLSGRIVTDVLVDGENFTEIYPHQAEDIGCEDISSIEIRSIPAPEMAARMSGELEKVAVMMEKGARGVASLFRDGKDADALELLQDLLDVTRDFMGLLSNLRCQYLGGADEEFASRCDAFSGLVSEMSDVMESSDWTLMGDLLEYEFAPACGEWRKAGAEAHRQLEAAAA